MKFKQYLSEEEKNLIGYKFNGVPIKPNQSSWPQSFICSNMSLTSLKGAPFLINGNFDCRKNKLTSLKDGPIGVAGNYDCEGNILTSLEGCPSEIKGYFDCSYNKLPSLKGCPTTGVQNFWGQMNVLTSLEGAPAEINGDFHCENNRLTSFKDIHKIIKSVNGEFVCRDNQIRSHVLGLLLTGTSQIVANTKWAFILNKHIGGGRNSVLQAQQELIEAGLEKYAQL